MSELVLPPSGEWSVPSAAWTFIQVGTGVGYWLHPEATQELHTGAVMVLGAGPNGCIRASQLGPVGLYLFRVDPEQLTGLVSLGEQLFLREAGTRDEFSFRILPPTNPISDSFLRLRGETSGSLLRVRLQMLQILVEFLGENLKRVKCHPEPDQGPKQRLAEVLKQTPVAQLLQLRLAQLVENTHCTPRHLSRLFHEVTGMSFREKKAQLRVSRARELLASTDWKIAEVAFESGYPSVGVLNVAFRERFGITPGKWREQIRTREGSRKISTRRKRGALLSAQRVMSETPAPSAQRRPSALEFG
jgi:AraC-like DNA-binding protein